MLHGLTQILFLLIGAVLLLGSGLGILWLIPSLRRSLTAIESIIVALLVSSGAGGVWATAGRIAGIRILPWAIVFLAVSALLAAAGGMARRRDRTATTASAADRQAVPDPRSAAAAGRCPEPEPRYYRTILIALAAFSFLLMARQGGSLSPAHDSLDFVSFVSESLQTGALAPPSPIYRAEPGIPPDPRRGSFHTQVAAICALSGTSPTDAWKWLPRLIVPIAILGLGAMLRVWIGARAAALATILFVATTFFTPDHFIQNIAYASRFGWICGWGALVALGRGLALAGDSGQEDPSASRAARGSAQPRDRRARLLLLGISAASPGLLLAVHLLTGFQVLLALGCAALAAVTYRDATAAERKSAVWTIVAAVVLLLPALAFRLAGTPKGSVAANPLFDHLYGVMLVAPGWPVLLPNYFFARSGITGLAAMILGLALLPMARRSRAAGFLAWSTLVPFLILFFPPITKIVVAAHAHSVLMRVILTIPFAGILAWTALTAIDRWRSGRAAKRAGAAALLAFVTLAIAGQVWTTRSAWTSSAKFRTSFSESRPLLDAYAFLDERFPARQTILSDPITSYSIPAYTRHDAVSPYEQHSSPSDPTVAARIRDVQEALNGRIGLARTFDVLRRYRVDLILVNQSFTRYASGYFVFVSPLAYDAQRSKFDGRPDLFEKVYDREGILIYKVRDPGPAARLPSDPANPDRIPDPGGAPIAVQGPVSLLRAEPQGGTHAQGDWLGIDAVFRCDGKPSDLPIVCDVKLQMQGDPDAGRADLLGRAISTFFVPDAKREIVRFGRTVRPLATFYPDLLWKPGETYKDVLWIAVHPQARSGTYDVYVRLRVEPYSPVVVLSEVLNGKLGPEWHRIGTAQIGR